MPLKHDYLCTLMPDACTWLHVPSASSVSLFSAVWMSQCRWWLNSSSTFGVFLSFGHSSTTSSLKSWRARSPLPRPRSPAHHRTISQLKVSYEHRPFVAVSKWVQWSWRLSASLAFLCFDRPLQASLSEVGLRAKHPETSRREEGRLSWGSEGVQHLCALPDGTVYINANTTPDTHRSVPETSSFKYYATSIFETSRSYVAVHSPFFFLQA